MATGISLSDTSNLSSGQKILVAQAAFASQPAAPDPELVVNVSIPKGHKQWDILTMARLTQASALTEGVDLAQTQQLVAASLSITPSEHGIIVTLSNRLIRRQGDQDVVGSVGRLMGQGLQERMAKDVIALYDGFSKSVVGASNAIDVTTFRGSVAFLLTDNDSAFGPAPMPLHAAFHIEQISDVILDLTDTAPRGTTTGFTDELIQRWWKGRDRLYGVQIFHSGFITRDGNGDSKGAIFNPDALRLVMVDMDSDDAPERDMSLRAKEYGLFREWGEGERADPWGVEVFHDAAATV